MAWYDVGVLLCCIHLPWIVYTTKHRLLEWMSGMAKEELPTISRWRKIYSWVNSVWEIIPQHLRHPFHVLDVLFSTLACMAGYLLCGTALMPVRSCVQFVISNLSLFLYLLFIFNVVVSAVFVLSLFLLLL